MPPRLPTRRTHRAAAEVLADGWYSWLGESDSAHDWTALSALIDGLPQPIARRILDSGPLRGLALAALSARYGAVAMIRYDRGWRTLLLARALLGRRRKLVVFQFFDHPPADARGRFWQRVDRWALRRSMALAQVLTEVELETYPSTFGIDPDRFRFVRFPARSARLGVRAPRPRDNGPVVAAGRAHCDWRTLFAAASGRGWDLQIVCSAEDRRLVEHLNAVTRSGAQVSVELPPAAAHALLSHAAISVICVGEGVVGRGHIRLMEATDTGTAVVASDVSSLRGYVQDGHTARLVPPGDPGALRRAIEELLRQRDTRRTLAETAFAAAAAWTGQDYVASLQALAAEVAQPAA
jgi:glycosyltransferase involved in cell wall biosynthesis